MSNYYNFPRPVPRTMPKKEAELLVIVLREIRQAASLENSIFSDELKKTVSLHHRTWIIGPIDDLIERYEGVK